MFGQFFIWFLDQLFPLKCIGCGLAEIKICDKCRQSLVPQPLWQDLNGLKVWSAFPYKGRLIEKIVQKWKYFGDQSLLAVLIRPCDFPKLRKFDYIVPVPLHKRRLVERGFNQSLQLAEILADIYDLPISKDLKRRRFTKPQAQLDRKQRLLNVKDAFIWRGVCLKGKSVLLVDDVVTTGSTMRECQQALAAVGVKRVSGLCLLRGGQ